MSEDVYYLMHDLTICIFIRTIEFLIAQHVVLSINCEIHLKNASHVYLVFLLNPSLHPFLNSIV
jgi:hypothetical protein